MITMFTMEELRLHRGLAADDTSQDASITAAMETAIAMAEAYTDRKLQWALETETFTHIAGYSIQLRRYPINPIFSLTNNDNVSGTPSYHADEGKGIIYFDGRFFSHSLTVTYEGGYDPLTIPADLKWALLRMFDSLLADQESGGSVGAGALKTAKIGDLAITYDTGSGSATTDSFMGAPVTSVLSKYKRFSA